MFCDATENAFSKDFEFTAGYGTAVVLKRQGEPRRRHFNERCATELSGPKESGEPHYNRLPALRSPHRQRHQ